MSVAIGQGHLRCAYHQSIVPVIDVSDDVFGGVIDRNILRENEMPVFESCLYIDNICIDIVPTAFRHIGQQTHRRRERVLLAIGAVEYPHF